MRKDGKRARNLDPMYEIAPYIMARRYDALNMIKQQIPLEPLRHYINAVRKSGTPMSYMSVIIAAYVRAAAEFPMLHRFVVNKRVYTRNEFVVSLVILRPGDIDNTMTKIKFEMTDTIFDVNSKINDTIEETRKPDDSNATDDIMRKLTRIPGLLSFAVNFLRWTDKHGWLPKAILDASPFHTSLVISNLASIRTNYIYHHLYDFGTSSVFITMGVPERVTEIRDGVPAEVRYLPLGIVMDERICSGGYFAKVFKRMSSYLDDPTLLEQPPAVVNADS